MVGLRCSRVDLVGPFVSDYRSFLSQTQIPNHVLKKSAGHDRQHSRNRILATERPHDRVLTTSCSTTSGARRWSGTAGGMATVTRRAFNP
jgi:hypothetical protein